MLEKILVFIITFPLKVLEILLTELFTSYRPEAYAEKVIRKDQSLSASVGHYQRNNKKQFATIRKLQTEASMSGAANRDKDKLISSLKQQIKQLECKLKEERENR